MSNRLRSVAIVELLASHPDGLSARAVSERLHIPISAVERLLSELVQTDYVRPGADRQTHRLRLKLAALGLAFLGASGVTDLVQPILDDLAKRCGELVRLAVIEGDQLTWVAKAQGSTSGLMYHPDISADVDLPNTANGQAWLSCLSRQDAEALLARHARSGPRTAEKSGFDRKLLFQHLDASRKRGYAFVSESYQTGTSALATAIRKPGTGSPIGTVSIAGPTLRLTKTRVDEMAVWLTMTAGELAAASASSPLFAAR
jgi:IclR family transcriptional regulator, acetate operon repressor